MIPQLPELATPTTGLVFAALATNLLSLLVLALLVRRRGAGNRDAGTSRSAESVPSSDGDARSAPTRVRCPECETANERGYRYCRECLSELPSAMRFDAGGSNPFRVLP